jgi:hypothetical protein
MTEEQTQRIAEIEERVARNPSLCIDLRFLLDLLAAEARGRQQAEQAQMPMPKSGPSAVLDQTDADNYYLATENQELRKRIEQAERELASVDAILARRPALDLPTRWQNIEKAITVAARCDKAEAIAADAKAQNERLVERVQQAEQARDEMKAWADAEREVASRLRTQVAALMLALKDYGQHKAECALIDDLNDCTCGFDAITGASK